MPQFILTETYVGSSDFVYEVHCTGRRLTAQEALSIGLGTSAQLRRFAKSDYETSWHQASAGDQIRFDIRESGSALSLTFELPDHLPSPPCDLDRDFHRLGRWQHEYYREHALQIS